VAVDIKDVVVVESELGSGDIGVAVNEGEADIESSVAGSVSLVGSEVEVAVDCMEGDGEAV
jgi:hypothetical protein